MDEHADEHTYIAWMNFQNILSKRSWKKDHILYESTSGRYSEQANLFFFFWAGKSLQKEIEVARG